MHAAAVWFWSLPAKGASRMMTAQSRCVLVFCGIRCRTGCRARPWARWFYRYQKRINGMAVVAHTMSIYAAPRAFVARFRAIQTRMFAMKKYAAIPSIWSGNE